MKRTWNPVLEYEARQHHLYGVRGWLLVFAVSVAFGALRTLGEVASVAHETGLSLGQFLLFQAPVARFFKYTLMLEGILTLAIYAALLAKHPSFRLIASSALIGGPLITYAIGASDPFPGLGEALGKALIPTALQCAIWVTYLQRSKRVRVTFEHLVVADATVIGAGDREHRVSESVDRGSSDGSTTEGMVSSSKPDTSLVQRSVARETGASGAQGKFDEKSALQTIADEVEQHRVDKGLWLKALIEAQGDENKRLYWYAKLRLAEETARHGTAIAHRLPAA